MITLDTVKTIALCLCIAIGCGVQAKAAQETCAPRMTQHQQG